ncbi:MAG: hypothetical protein ACRDK7_03990, partial [Solirubrobacteraceae bacterium]
AVVAAVAAVATGAAAGPNTTPSTAIATIRTHILIGAGLGIVCAMVTSALVDIRADGALIWTPAPAGIR